MQTESRSKTESHRQNMRTALPWWYFCSAGQGGPDRRTTAGPQLTIIPELRSTFFKQSNWTHARQECQERYRKKKKTLSWRVSAFSK
jgi:hypothetical protein